LVLLTILIASPAFGRDATEEATTARKRFAKCHEIADTTTIDKVPEWHHITNDPQHTRIIAQFPDLPTQQNIANHTDPAPDRQSLDLLSYIATLLK
jgi:hypothetical protein